MTPHTNVIEAIEKPTIASSEVNIDNVTDNEKIASRTNGNEGLGCSAKITAETTDSTSTNAAGLL